MLSDQKGKEMQNQANKSGHICESRNAEVHPEVIHEIMQLKIIKAHFSIGNVRNKIDKPSFGRPYQIGVSEATEDKVPAVLYTAHDADIVLGTPNWIF